MDYDHWIIFSQYIIILVWHIYLKRYQIEVSSGGWRNMIDGFIDI